MSEVEPIRQKNWKVFWKIEKFLYTPEGGIDGDPDEVLVIEDNILLNDGISAMLSLLIGSATYPPFSNANSYIGIGDSAVAAAATQTDLQAVTNKSYMPMNATYPLISAQSVVFKSNFAAGVASYAWNEIGVFNGAAVDATHKMLNRKVVSLGTKGAAATWVVTLSITIS